MADLNKIRVQVLDPETGQVVENVDVKTSDNAVYLPDGTTLRNYIDNTEEALSDVQKSVAEHLAVKHVDTGVTGSEIAVTVSGNEVSAALVDGGISRDKIDSDFEADIAALENNLGTTSVPDQISGAIAELDATVTNSDDDPDIVVTVVETDGKLTSVSTSVKAETFDAYGAAAAVQGESTETVASLDTKIDELATSSTIDFEKLETATDGFIASYIIKQNGTQVGPTLDIPKDYLVKSAELKVATEDIKSGETVLVTSGHQYIDFVVNTVEGSGNESHIYIDVSNLVDVYTGGTTDEIAVSISDTNEITATLVDGGITYDKLADALKDKIDNSVSIDGEGAPINLESDDSTVVLTVTGPTDSTVYSTVGTAVGDITINATASGEGAANATITYQWYKKTVGTDSAFTAIAGATAATLASANIANDVAGTTIYYAVVTATGTDVTADPVASKKVTVVIA